MASGRYGKVLSGRHAVTVQFGSSTTALIDVADSGLRRPAGWDWVRTAAEKPPRDQTFANRQRCTSISTVSPSTLNSTGTRSPASLTV